MKSACSEYSLLKKLPGIIMLALSLSLLFSNTIRSQNPVRGRWQPEGDSLVLRTYSKSHFLAARKDGSGLGIAEEAHAGSSLIKVKGNIRYDFLYRSFSDTPFTQRDLRQHTIQASLEIQVKDRYPLRLNLATRFSNSLYFRDFFDFNLAWDPQRLLRQRKEQLLRRVEQRLRSNPDLSLVSQALEEEKGKLTLLQYKLQQPDIRQRIMEEKERQLHNWRLQQAGRNPVDPSGTDSLNQSFSNLLAEKKREADSLRHRIATLQRSADSIQFAIRDSLQNFRRKVQELTRLPDLQRLENMYGLAREEGRSHGSRFLSGITQVGIGRSVLQYSELTAMNVSLTGLHVEYNQGLYAAVAAGKVDYGFRDLWGRNRLQKSQHLLLGRMGWGDKEKLAFILTGYTGTKMPYVATLPDSLANKISLAGYSLEVIYRKNRYTSLVAEVAKSTTPVTGNLRENGEWSKLFRFSDTRNMGISVKGQTTLAATGTRLAAILRKTGEHFQSYSLFAQNTGQVAWSVRMDQPIWKSRLHLAGQLRKNDFTNPFTEKTFRTSTVFASVQASLRIPRWPVLSAGYYPGTQIYFIDKERMRENAYYMINASMVYNYRTGSNHQGLSMIMYSRFQSQATDSGFIQYNGATYMVQQSWIGSRMQLGGSWSYNDQPELRFYTLESSLDLSVSKMIRAGIAYRFSRIPAASAYHGGRIQVEWNLKLPGTFRLQYDKSFLPTIRRDLFPVETGRISWYKTF